ncbi:hemerythrin domain-containing protein [Amycolatopsis sp.]|uniref:hemerythrin domain-containing protein n=1 Tax=Amycolatopsis sp. TaxID=37632 RepID=UPI002C19844D|nr:hemerythrin domain-containing protein [Amycolatopsis sp.]HVV14598.1 hemerythrin domain-containing protein [Amycolatopsis sp.]
MTTKDKERPAKGRVDFTMMYAAHDAFRRDLAALVSVASAGRAADAAVRAGWATFKNQLHIHHTVEDTALWPPLRDKVHGPYEAAILDAMEAEHAQLDPLLSSVDKAIAADDRAGLADRAQALSDALGAHMEHEEDEALPLVELRLGVPGWAGFLDAIRRRQGLRGGAEFLPWLLDGAGPELRRRVLAGLPAPARILFRLAWRPRYVRTARWSGR